MPRKKPFSSKQKKFQLQEKRRRKRNGNFLHFNKSIQRKFEFSNNILRKGI